MRANYAFFSTVLALRFFCLIASLSLIGVTAWAQEQQRLSYRRAHFQSFADANRTLAQMTDRPLVRKRPLGRAGRIAGGVPGNFKHFGDTVLIRFRTSSGQNTICSGVIIAIDSVLTAGHCGCGHDYSIHQQIGTSLQAAGRLPNLKVIGGPMLFPGYDCRIMPDRQVGRDLAVIRIEALKDGFGVTAQPMILQPVIRSAIDVLSDVRIRSLLIAGFGRLEDGSLADSMQIAYAGVLSRRCDLGSLFLSVCAMHREFILSNTALTPTAKPVDTCRGDSGGPVYIIYEDPPARRPPEKTLVGITSRALTGVRHAFPGFCGGGGIYTAVGTQPVLAWLRSLNVAYKFAVVPNVDETQP